MNVYYLSHNAADAFASRSCLRPLYLSVGSHSYSRCIFDVKDIEIADAYEGPFAKIRNAREMGVTRASVDECGLHSEKGWAVFILDKVFIIASRKN